MSKKKKTKKLIKGFKLIQDNINNLSPSQSVKKLKLLWTTLETDPESFAITLGNILSHYFGTTDIEEEYIAICTEILKLKQIMGENHEA